MKFFKRINSSGELLSSKKSEEISLKTCLDHFSTYGKIGKTIIDNHKYVINKLGKEYDNLTSHDFDKELNKELIRDRAIRKYEVEAEDFYLNNADWFPRIRTIKFNEDEETGSIYSDFSDFIHDGFAGPFSWETKSLQELRFPPTPEAERKNNNNVNTKNKKNKNKKASSTDLTTNDHRNYETLEELRGRLYKNYNEAKVQREKYLNINSVKTKEEIAQKSINGYRNKKKIGQNIHKNYKTTQDGDLQQQNGATKKQNGELNLQNGGALQQNVGSQIQSGGLKQESNISKANIEEQHIKQQNSQSTTTNTKAEAQPLKSASSNSFTAELSSAIMKHSSSGSSIVTNTPRSTSSYSVKSDLDITSKNDNDILFANGDVNDNINSAELIRKSSTRSRKRSGSKSGSVKRRNSLKKSASPSKTSSDNSLVMENSLANDEDDVGLSLKSSTEEKNPDGLNNIMDMLANW